MENQGMRFCQSCGMPLGPDVPSATEADGAPNPDFCGHCYQNGRYTWDCSMAEMIDFCAPLMAQSNPGMTEEQARVRMQRFFPQLKRWRG